ncbi:COesterase domain-containing protein [Aphelenchoides fujianensis]|nr:COesterase domain-containing protein [Aphelenchoides fujianensis]
MCGPPRALNCGKSHPIELTIKSGSIRGEYLTIGANDFAVFKGIPYAAPPVGQTLRFQTQFSPMCAQFPRTRPTDPQHLYKTHISEDCLYLNVFAPPPFANDSYPVIVWLHGGSFQSGSASDFPQEAILNNFVSRKVVFITLNYRLGPMGFLSTGDEVMSGNVGLWDQIQALRWVQENAPVFVMLMGHGAGASCASILALSPRAEGLFHKVVLMSGTAISPGAVRETAYNATWALDQKLHCRSFNSTELLDCFKKQLKDEILDVTRTHYDDYEEFVPTVDGSGGIIPEPPEVLLTYRPKIPLMIGTTRDESALRLLLLDEKELAENLTQSYTGFINHPLIAEGCKHEYIWRKVNPSADPHILFESVLNMYSHFWFDAPASRLATAYSEQMPVFLYSFDHVSENFETDRAFHGVDEVFLFEKEPRFLETRKDKELAAGPETDLIVNFLKHGHPTPEGAGFPFVWNSTRMEILDYLSITDVPEMKVGFRWDGHVFWNMYARHLDAVDVGNLQRIAQLDKQLGDYQLATWMLLFCALFFFAILVGLACYCTRKESDDDDL